MWTDSYGIEISAVSFSQLDSFAKIPADITDGLFRQSLNGTGAGTGKNGSLYIMPKLYTATYVGPGLVLKLWHCISPDPGSFST